MVPARPRRLCRVRSPPRHRCGAGSPQIAKIARRHPTAKSHGWCRGLSEVQAHPALVSSLGARMGPVELARVAWLATVLACLIAVAILVLQGYYGYAGVTLAVAASAAINLK